MNYTNNYHLPQWEKSDRVLMDDFNQAMNCIESGINSAVQHGTDTGNTAADAAAKALASADAAQAAADEALSAASAAQTSADAAYRPGYVPYAVGSFTGTGNTTRISLGFRPRFAIIIRQWTSSMYGEIQEVWTVGPGTPTGGSIEFNSTGLTVSAAFADPRLNQEGYTYSYIAFR